MRKQHVYFSKVIHGYPGLDSVELNRYGYKLNFVRWFYSKISTGSNVYKDVVIKRRYPAGGCVERTIQSFDIAAPKETWNIALVDYAKELGAKWLDVHPGGVIEQDRFGNWCYITRFSYDNECGYARCLETLLYDYGYCVDATSPNAFNVILQMAKSNKTPLLINNKYYFLYNRNM